MLSPSVSCVIGVCPSEAHTHGMMFPAIYVSLYICCAQTMDRDNPWIAHSIRGSCKRGTQSMDLGQTMDGHLEAADSV